MTWPPKQRTRTGISWTLQIQYKPGGWWSDHTAHLSREDAEALMAERQTATAQCRYRLVRATTTYSIERQDGARQP